MNQVKMNTVGLLESLDERLAQVYALVSSAHRTVSSCEASIYLSEAGKLLQIACELTHEAQGYSASLSSQLLHGKESE
ncbi:TPA: hypothetical protein NY165_004257 [Escherichia coli]|nr:hypothetical protein [Escherichia coli]